MKTLILLALLTTPAIAWQDTQQDFNSGYTEGYKAQRGDMVLVPLTPLAPLTPLGSTPYREGLKRGFQDGQPQGYQTNPYSSPYSNRYE